MNLKKGFQRLATVLSIAVVLWAISGLAIGMLHLAIRIALCLAIICLIYRSVIFVADGFKGNG
jgi:hypothetical protein